MTFIFMLLVVAAIAGLIYSIAKKTYSRKIIIGFFSVLVGLLVLFTMSMVGSSSNDAAAVPATAAPVVADVVQTAAPVVTEAPTQTPQPTPKMWSKVDEDHNVKIENFSIVVPSTPDKTALAAIAVEARTELCTRQCNIWLFKTAKAAKMDRQFNYDIDGTEMDSWKAANGQYMRENVLGMLQPDDTTITTSTW